jgi:FKBP-type peptidyl-prolyl cis-trans isomerase
MKRFVLSGVVMMLFFSCEKDLVIPPYKEQLANDIAAIDEYLVANMIAAEADTSGLRYIISVKGSAFKPIPEDSIKVNFSLKLLPTGQAISTDVTNTFLLSRLVRAWRIVLPLMGEGGKATLFVPSGLAYGAYPTGPIPANSNLIFDIELTNVIKEFSGQLERDKTAIDAYLTANNVTAVKDGSGLRYVVTSPGPASAFAPVLMDSVVINYEGKLLTTETTFEQATSKGFKLSAASTLRVWKSALPLFRQGTKATLYVPSGLGYGAYGKEGVPRYANLVYTVELVNVIRK